MAGVTVATLTGENGLLSKAALAGQKNKEAEDDEKDKLSTYEDELAKYTRSGGSGGGTTVINGKVFGMNLVTEGEGTESSPFIITNKEQLYILAALVNSGNSFEGKFIKLGDNIPLDSTKQWTPIGNSNTTRFEGTFDGDGKTISGLYINNLNSGQGLFGTIGGNGSVKKFKLEGNVSASANSGCIASVNYGTISNCINNATFNYNESTVVYGQAGICGSNNGIIYQCANLAQIKGSRNVGGITGGNYNIGIVKECYNTGKIIGDSATGGIVGSNTKYIYNCYNNAQVSASYAGGIIGYGSMDCLAYNVYTINNTTICGSGSTSSNNNNYTTNANTKLNELNAGIDEVGATTSTESPWVADDTTNPINGGYPILSWQVTPIN